MSDAKSGLNSSGRHYNPYQNYRFKMKWDDSYVAAFSKVSGLSHETQVIDHRSGGDPVARRIMSSQNTPLTLERGVTYDITFQQWADKVWDYSNAAKAPENSDLQPAPSDTRKDIVIELYNEAGQKVIAYKVFRCWPSAFNAMPELDGTGNVVVIETMTLQNEGWERVTSGMEPAEPPINLPG